MGSLVLAGATSGSTTITPTDAVTATVTLPSTGGTLQTSGAGFTTNGVAYATSTSALATGSALVFNGTNLGLGTSSPSGIATYPTMDIRGTDGGGLRFGTSASANAYLYCNTNIHLGTPSSVGIIFEPGNAEAGRFDSSGNFLVGTATPVGAGRISLAVELYTAYSGIAIKNTGTTYTSTTDYMSFLNSSGSQAGHIYQSASTTVVYATSSDARLKTLIKVATETSVIDNIVINDFTWKDDGKVDRGVFAQDAYKIIPNAISEGTDELTEDGSLKTPWGVDYSKFVPDLIVHAQQLKKQVQELSALVTAQSATITSLTERITALEGK